MSRKNCFGEFTTKFNSAVLALVLLAVSASAQNFPFPQHATLVHGVKPGNVSQTSMDNTVSNFWSTYKSRYVKSASTGGYYIAYNLEGQGDTGASTVSEAHGYGMVLCAYMGDKTHFDGMYTYYKNHPSQNNSKLMAWQQDTSFNDINGADSATDGDMDIAYSLLIADKQWGSGGTINYLQAATNMINAIMQSDVNQSQWTLRLGDWATSGSAGGFSFSTATRPSDFMFDHMWAYFDATHDTRWTNVIYKTYAIVNQIFANNSPNTGLIPDFVVLNGSTYQPAPANFLEGANDGKYSYNSCRTPWRFATEYMVRGSSGILTEIRKMNTWIQSKTGGNPDNVFPGYSLSGTALDSSYTDDSFTSPFGVCAMTDSSNQTWLNSLWSWIAARGINTGDGYFGNSITMQCVLVVSGNWWQPVYSTPDFSVAAAPDSDSTTPGGQANYTATITPINGFNSTVTFSVTGLPTGAIASFSPTSVTGSGSSSLTVTTSGSTPAGTYTLTVKGTSGSLNHSDTVNLVVQDFTISATPSSQIVTAGNSTTYTVNVGNVNGFTGNVTFSVSGLGSGASAVFNPTSIGGLGSSTLTISTTSGAATGTFNLTITGTSGSLSHSAPVTLVVNPAGGPLPSGWTDVDVGAVGVAGDASYTSGTFTLDGSGSDIWSTADEFHYAYESTNGDVTVIARVATVESTAAWAKAGVMIRETTAVNSAYVGLYVTPSNGVSMQLRPATGSTAIDLARQTGLTAPYWVKLVRSGSAFTGFSSPNGSAWTQVGTTNITMASGITAGLVDCAHNDTTLNTSTCDNVSVSVAGNTTLYFEAEDLSYTTNGAAVNVIADAAASGGTWLSLLSTNSGPWVEFTLTNIPAGSYDFTFFYKQHPNRAIHSLTVDGVKLDGDLDQYSATVSYTNKDFGVITFATAGIHTVRLTTTGKNASAGTPNVSADAFQLTPASQTWSHQDVGAVGLTGSFSQSVGTYTVAGSGSDIWTAADQFHYAYQAVSGDVTITARVASETQTASFAKAAVMLRASLATNSVEASVLLTPTNGVAMEVRPATGASTINVTGWVTGPTPPSWVRLTRSGNTFTAFSSSNGTSWTQIGSTNMTMSAGVTAGLAVTSHDNTKLNTSTFDNVSLP